MIFVKITTFPLCTTQGTRVEMVGESKLAYNQTPLMLYAGQLTTMLSTG